MALFKYVCSHCGTKASFNKLPTAEQLKEIMCPQCKHKGTYGFHR